LYESFCYLLQDLPGSLPFILINPPITQFAYPQAKCNADKAITVNQLIQHIPKICIFL